MDVNFDVIEPVFDGTGLIFGVSGFVIGIIFFIVFCVKGTLDHNNKFIVIIAFLLSVGPALFGAIFIFSIPAYSDNTEAVTKQRVSFQAWAEDKYLVTANDANTDILIENQVDVSDKDAVTELPEPVLVTDSYGDFVGVYLVKTSDTTWELVKTPLDSTSSK